MKSITYAIDDLAETSKIKIPFAGLFDFSL